MQVMSSARGTPDSRRSRSLLQSRSLRDFCTPPPSSRPEKSRRRVLQVNGPYVVREVYPPIPGITQSSQAEPVQTPQNPRSKSPASSIQVSPFLAAPRASFDAATSSPASSYGVPSRHLPRPSSSPSHKGVHELRNPPVNPRRHRRLCSDFGLDRDQSRVSPSPPVPEVSSLASTPLATYTETESDSDTSVNQALDFPEPPPIDETLHLRRMRSSPMFTVGETDKVKEFLRKRQGAATQASHGSPSPYDHWDRVSTLSIESRYTADLEGLDMTHLSSNRATIDSSPRTRSREQTLSFSSHTPQSPGLATPPPSSRIGERIAWKRATTTTMPLDRASDGTPVSLARSATSIGTRIDHPSTKLPSVSAGQISSSRPPPELSEPMDRLDLSIEKLRKHDPQHLQSNRAAVLGEHTSKPQPPLPISPPSLASAGRKKPTHRPHLSVPTPLAGSKLPPAHETRSMPSFPEDLGVAFNHRSTRNHPAVREPRLQPNHPPPRSFMDITPEQEVQRSSRARVRKLLNRASVSIFGWGKNKSNSK
ncbi:hypothetical protein DXG01_006970 [Tephrocybe rancida]|nr:hypothetical protein DXG01_006970 [Tephrocybe rancida]